MAVGKLSSDEISRRGNYHSAIRSGVTLKSYTSNKISCQFLATLLFFIVTTIFFTNPIGEGDFFWHVKSGQWIWENKALPTVDHFSHITSFLANTPHTLTRTAFVLKQYWLAQLALFGVWNIAGEAGMVFMRMCIYFSILFFLYRWLRSEKSGLVPLATIFVIGNELMTFPNERPQIFAYLFFVILLWLLEKITNSVTRTSHIQSLSLAALMLVWGNTHGSFILGIVVITIYLFSWIVTTAFNKHPDNTWTNSYPVILVAAIAASGINPNGFKAFQLALDLNKRYAAAIGEYISPVTLATKHGLIDYYYWVPLLLTLMLVIIRFRIMPLRHTLTLVAIGILSTTAQRYIPLFMLTLPLAAFHLPDFELKRKWAVIPLILIIVWGATQEHRNVLKFRASKGFPAGATTFLNQAQPSGEIFNTYEWGGYVMLYSNYKVFADGRGLAENFTELQRNVLEGFNWQGILSYFKINTIITDGTDHIRNAPYRLMWELRNAHDWVLVYQDDTALVFVRDIPENKTIIARYALGKERITRHLEERREWQFKGEY